jgi:hypothetical protein
VVLPGSRPGPPPGGRLRVPLRLDVRRRTSAAWQRVPGFEVNGWHNVVHVLSGLLLLAAYRRRSLAKDVALGFGLVYGVVAIIGLVDGNDVVGLIPVNAADNVLHVALSALGIATGLVSRGSYRRDRVLAGDRRADDRDLVGRFSRETADDAVAQRQERQRR